MLFVMDIAKCIAIVLNVNREAFTLPWIHLTIYWYGVLFAFGFFLGYLFALYFYKRYLATRRSFALYDIRFQEFSKKWSLLSTLGQSRRCFHALSFEDEKAIETGYWTVELKQKVLGLINACESYEAKKIDWKASHKRLFRFLERKGISSQPLRQRLALEERYPTVFKSINERAKSFLEKLTLFVVVGTVVGARLGHILFYENIWHYLHNPLLIMNTREGGLASHGGAIGIFLALLFLKRHFKKCGDRHSWLFLLDTLMIPTAIAAIWIRIGNFINQEIVGTPTQLVWGMVFPNNFEGLSNIARHPVQLYEALSYFLVAVFLSVLWSYRWVSLKEGELSGWFLTLVFGSRFFLEFCKESQLQYISSIESILSMGQWLSLPMVALGITLLLFANMNKTPAVYRVQTGLS